jgi:hypothetical protein
MEGDTRFFRGLQLELAAPLSFLAHRGSIAVELFGELDRTPDIGATDLIGRRLGFDLLPARLQTIYQIPIMAGHGFRTSPYATVLSDVICPSSFPLIFRLNPVIHSVSDDLKGMVFRLNVRPILSNEGALRINFLYPENLPGRPFTVLINDEVIENPKEERVLNAGEHHLVVLSEDYRNHSSRFFIERARILDLTVELQDTTPILIFERPENARVYLNNVFIPDSRSPWPVAPGFHEIRFQVSDYTIIRPLFVQRGKTYRVALFVDIVIFESD